MSNIETWVMENSTLIAVAAGVLFVLVIVLMAVSSARKKAKKNALLQADSNLVEIAFDSRVYPPRPVGKDVGYTLYAVNGQTPQILGQSVLAPSGEVVLDYEYAYQNGSFIKSCGRSTYTLQTLPGKKYTMSFDFMDGKMLHKEK